MGTTMSITKALAKVKNINKKLNDLQLVKVAVVSQGNSSKLIEAPGLGSKEEFLQNSKGYLDQVNDLISQRQKLKFAIAKANSEAKVKIGNKEYTIIEAIDNKDILLTKIELYDTYLRQFAIADDFVQRQEDKIASQVESLAKAAAGSSAQQRKDTTESLEASVRLLYEGKIVSNYSREQILKLKSEAEEELNETDMVLSEINSRTDIEVDL